MQCHCNREGLWQTANALQAYTISRESRQIIASELARVSGRIAHEEMTDAGSIEFSIRAKLASREAVALVSLEESAVLELSIQLPSAWPLQDAKVDCRKGVRQLPPSPPNRDTAASCA